MAIFFGILRVTGLFRVDPKDEEEGLDHSYHGGSAYGDSTGEFKPTYSKVRFCLQYSNVSNPHDFLGNGFDCCSPIVPLLRAMAVQLCKPCCM